jgi:hypothetical protein
VKLAHLVLVLSSVAACGGGTPAPTEPKAGHDDAKRPASDDTSAVADDAPQRSPRVRCDDGSCFSCGEAICLSGFYCAVGKSGHGCAWLPSCSGKPTCSCLAAQLQGEPSCSCEEKEGGIFVACDGAKL